MDGYLVQWYTGTDNCPKGWVIVFTPGKFTEKRED
jgi:hypothetical protein